jgi:hypothetical protein
MFVKGIANSLSPLAFAANFKKLFLLQFMHLVKVVRLARKSSRLLV